MFTFYVSVKARVLFYCGGLWFVCGSLRALLLTCFGLLCFALCFILSV